MWVMWKMEWGKTPGGPFVPSDFFLFHEWDQQKKSDESFDACGISICLELLKVGLEPIVINGVYGAPINGW